MLLSRSHLLSSAARSARVGSPPMAVAMARASVRTRSCLVVQRAELRLEGHALQRLEVGVEAVLAVGAVEERGVGQARAHHALVAGDHLRRVAALDVGDRDEPRHQPALCVAHREVALVLLHRRDRHLGRQLEELRVEAAGERHRPFDQGRDLVEQRGVDDGVAADALRRRRDAGADGFAPRVDVGHDLAALQQRRHVGRRRRQTDRLRRHEAVAVGEVAGAHPEYLGVDHLATEQHHDPVHRAHELRLARAPAHAPGDRQRIERRGHDAGQQRRRRRARLGAAIDQPLALGRCQPSRAPTPRRRNRGRRRARPASAHRPVERGLHRRAALLERSVGLLLGEPLRRARRGAAASRTARPT